jgi:hypothetical protein
MAPRPLHRNRLAVQVAASIGKLTVHYFWKSITTLLFLGVDELRFT